MRLNLAADPDPNAPEGLAPSDDASPGEPVPLAIRAALARYFDAGATGLNLPLAGAGHGLPAPRLARPASHPPR